MREEKTKKFSGGGYFLKQKNRVPGFEYIKFHVNPGRIWGWRYIFASPLHIDPIWKTWACMRSEYFSKHTDKRKVKEQMSSRKIRGKQTSEHFHSNPEFIICSYNI